MINNKYPTTKPSLNLDFANTKSLDPRITFRRGTPGTYYDGVTHAKAEENLIDYSEDFSVWSATPTLLEPLAVGGASPIGTQAYKFIADTTPSSVTFGYLPLSKSELLTSYSIHVKADGFDYAWFGVCWDGSNYVSFVVDLVNGKVLDQYTRNRDNILIDADVLEVGNGWYRVKYVSDGYTANYMSIGGFFNPATDISSDGRPNFSGDGVSGILLWGAQVETRNAVTSYTATNGTPITKYQPKLMTAAADHARFDHDPITGESKGLLIEEQRSNLVASSEDFLLGNWKKHQNDSTNYIYIQENSIVSPGGEADASKMYITEGMLAIQGGYLECEISLTDNTIYTTSVYAKKAEYKILSFQINTKDNAYSSIVADLNDGIISSSTAVVDSSIEHVGNEWYRIEVSFDSKSGSTTPRIILQVRNDDGVADLETNNGIYIWGAQLEEGSFPTSYIKTTGASATRSADNASITGENFSSWYRQDEGSIYCESYSYNDYVQRILNISDSSSNNRIVISAINSEQLLVKNNTNTEISIDAGSYTVGEFLKQGTAYKDDSFFVTLGGNLGSSIDRTDSTSDGSVPKSLNKLNIGCSEVNNFYLNGHIKKIAYYPQRLTNEQLQNLTK